MSGYQKKLYGSATVGTKGQIVIPVEARDELGIEAGDKLFVVGSAEYKWVGFIKEDQLRELIDKITSSVDDYKNILKNRTN